MTGTTDKFVRSLRDTGQEPGSGGPVTRAGWLGWLGIALGLVAFLIPLPPFEVRTAVPSYLLALIAVTLGVSSILGGEKRVGGGAIAAGLFGALGAYGATKS